MRAETLDALPDGARFDFVVVGSGFGGSVAALRLAEKGYSVAVLEAGRHFEDGDFPRTNWRLDRWLWAPRFGCLGIQRLTFLDDALVLSGAGVGGGSLVYANTLLEPGEAFYASPECRRLAPDLRERLAPHFRTARRMLGAVPVPRLFPADEALRRVAAGLGREGTFHRAEVGVHFGEPGLTAPDPYFGGEGPPRAGCVWCGGCMVGCRHNAKNTLPKNYLHLACRRGARVFALAGAVRIEELQGSRGGFAVTVRRPGWSFRSKRLLAGSLVLSAGVLGTVRLLLEPSNRLSRLPPRLGRDVRTNSEVLSGSTARSNAVDWSEGLAITSGIWPDDETHAEVVRYPAGSDAASLLAMRHARGDTLLRRLGALAAAVAARPLDTWRLRPPGWARRTTILLFMQAADSRLRLVLRRSPLGRRLASEPEEGAPPPPRTLPAAELTLERFCAETGGVAQDSIAGVLLGLSTTAHILGGAAMGRGPEEGVVDLQGRVFGYENLRVLDGSVVPANLGVNPALTIAALAEHAMESVPPKR